MKIELRCEDCGKIVRAPREAAGKRAKCPSCGSDLYIPTPEDELEELPLAPEDTDAVRREAALQAERRQLERIISHDRAGASGGEPPAGRARGGRSAPAAAAGGGGGGGDVDALVIDYLRALRDANLDGADETLGVLKTQRARARQVVERLIGDQIPPPELADVPPAVYQGFLKRLGGEL